MAEKKSYTISDIYQGGYSSLTPNYGDVFTGYRIPVSQIGAPTKPDTANQIQQITQLLNQGIIPIEVGSIQPEIFNQIPKQHFKEMNRMAKLTGAKISVHAPLVEPSGMTQEGWSESNRELAERQLNDVVEKSHELDPTGNIPITIHSAGIPGTEYAIKDNKKIKERLIVINQETKKMAPIEEEKKFYPGEKWEKGEVLDLDKELKSLNSTEWINNLTNLEFYKKEADEVMRGAMIPLAPILSEKRKISELTPEQQAAAQQLERAGIFLHNVETSFNSAFNKAAQYSEDKISKEILKDISEDWIKTGKKMEEMAKSGELNELNSVIIKSQLLDKSLRKIKEVNTPNLYVPIEDWAINHSSETLANVAFHSYEKYKNNAPAISIENLYPGMAFSTGEEMNKLITETRKRFVDKALSEGVSKGVAEEQAEKIIGMTLDVGHLNIARKKGFKEEDLLKEVKEIAKHVKHVHLTDNFGYSDSHLPPGMGNVPTKEIMEELEKAGFKGRKIVEAGGFVQHFGVSPYSTVLEALGSPIYAMKMAPYWNQVPGLYQGYYGGFGTMLPQINYQTFGAGFSQLPTELGGQMPGQQGSRLSGNPME